MSASLIGSHNYIEKVYKKSKSHNWFKLLSLRMQVLSLAKKSLKAVAFKVIDKTHPKIHEEKL